MARSSQTIRDLNDRFRNGDTTIPGRIMVTDGVQTLIAEHDGRDIADVVAEVCLFDNFDAGNDPYHEHDFGAFDFLGERLFWKIDYYALDLLHGSEDPADTKRTVRILTIMLASEY